MFAEREWAVERMSYRLIDANTIQIEYPKVNELPCIYVDLPNGLDNSYHFISTDDINAAHKSIGYEKGRADGYAEALESEPKVRCKDCKYLTDDRIAPNWQRRCGLYGVGKAEDGYCDEVEVEK